MDSKIETFFRYVIENSSDLMCCFDLSGRVLWSNPSWEKAIKTQFGEKVSDNIYDLINQNHELKIREELKKLLNGQIAEVDTVVQLKLENQINHCWHHYKIYLHDQAFFVIARDATHCEINKQIFSEVSKTFDLGGWIYCVGSKKIFIKNNEFTGPENKDCEKILDIDVALQPYTNDSREKIKKAIETCVQQQRSFNLEVEYSLQPNSAKQERITGHPLEIIDGKVTKIIGAFQNITNIVKWQRVAFEGSTESAKLMALAKVGVLFLSIDGIVKYWSDAAEEIYGFERSQILGKNFKNVYVSKETLHKDEDTYEEAIEKLKAGKFVTFKADRVFNDGIRKRIVVNATPISNTRGEIADIAVAVMDISQISHMEKIVEEYTDLLNASSIVTYTDKKGNITYVNDLFCKVSGYSREELIGKNQNIVSSHYHSKIFWVDMWTTISKGETWRGLIRNQKKSGEYYWVQSVIMPRFDEGKNIVGYASIRTDITQQVKAEQRALYSSKLASVGELAAGVGHEIANALTVSDGNVFALKKRLKKLDFTDEKVGLYLEKYAHASERIVKIIRSLKSYAGSSTENWVNTNALLAIKQVYELVKDIYAQEGILFNVDNLEGIYPVYAKTSFLQQIFMNILNSSRNSMRGSKVKKINIKIKSLNDEFIVEISDTGLPLPKKTCDTQLGKDPFLYQDQTRSLVELSTAADLVEKQNGKMTCECDVDQTKIIVRLPLVSMQKKEIEVPWSESEVSNLCKGILALVVDDDHGVREVLSRLLKRFGIPVTEVESNAAALQVENLSGYGLIFTDQDNVQPSGELFSDQLSRISFIKRPKIILVSGRYSEEELEQSNLIASRGLDGVLIKPFSFLSLGQLLYQKFVKNK